MVTHHKNSPADKKFLADFRNCFIPLASFAHAQHVRLAYVLLVENDFEEAHEKLKVALLTYLSHNGVDAGKFHETLTHAWLSAVCHFMHLSRATSSSDEFLRENPTLLDQSIMLTHYSQPRLESDAARLAVIEPDLSIIPQHI